MSKVGGDFSHYAGRQVAHKTDAERKAAVAAIVAARRAKEAEEAELERIAAEQYVPFTTSPISNRSASIPTLHWRFPAHVSTV